MERDSVILVTGSCGMVGSALLRLLTRMEYPNILAPARSELDLRNTTAVDAYFNAHKPTHVFMVAARVGGIEANRTDPVGFLTDNLAIQQALFEACVRHGTRKNLFLGSSCIYPRDCAQPMKEEYLMQGPLEPTNEGYALAKIVGLRLAQYYHAQFGMLTVCPMPCNIYGTNDHFDFNRAHVLSALVRRFVEAKDEGSSDVMLWGTGVARREFIHVDDVAEAMLHLMKTREVPDIINLGPGEDLTIRDLAMRIKETVGFDGSILWDTTKPDGMPRKCLDVSEMRATGFFPRITLNEGIRRTIYEYRSKKVGKRHE